MTGIVWLDWLFWISGALSWLGIVGVLLLLKFYFKGEK